MLKNLNPNEFYLVSAISALCLLVQIFGPDSLEILRYQTKAVSSGEWWRILSANFCHSNWNHLLLNLAGLWIIDYLFQPTVNQQTRAALLSFSMIVNVLLLHCFLELDWYVGLSGALHGYLIGNAIISWNENRWLSLVILIGGSAKIGIELTWEINNATASLIEANVVEEAHLFGAISALIYAICRIPFVMKQSQKKGD